MVEVYFFESCLFTVCLEIHFKKNFSLLDHAYVCLAIHLERSISYLRDYIVGVMTDFQNNKIYSNIPHYSHEIQTR